MDPVAGPVFYTLDQVKVEKPKFTLQPTDCLACHDTFESEKPVPRLLMLSVLSDPTGVALNRSSIVTNDKSPFARTVGRLVRDRNSRQSAAHGQSLVRGTRGVAGDNPRIQQTCESERRARISRT